jgi:hypothetical protein
VLYEANGVYGRTYLYTPAPGCGQFASLEGQGSAHTRDFSQALYNLPLNEKNNSFLPFSI